MKKFSLLKNTMMASAIALSTMMGSPLSAVTREEAEKAMGDMNLAENGWAVPYFETFTSEQLLKLVRIINKYAPTRFEKGSEAARLWERVESFKDKKGAELSGAEKFLLNLARKASNNKEKEILLSAFHKLDTARWDAFEKVVEKVFAKEVTADEHDEEYRTSSRYNVIRLLVDKPELWEAPDAESSYLLTEPFCTESWKKLPAEFRELKNWLSRLKPNSYMREKILLNLAQYTPTEWSTFKIIAEKPEIVLLKSAANPEHYRIFLSELSSYAPAAWSKFAAYVANEYYLMAGFDNQYFSDVLHNPELQTGRAIGKNTLSDNDKMRIRVAMEKVSRAIPRRELAGGEALSHALSAQRVLMYCAESGAENAEKAAEVLGGLYKIFRTQWELETSIEKRKIADFRDSCDFTCHTEILERIEGEKKAALSKFSDRVDGYIESVRKWTPAKISALSKISGILASFGQEDLEVLLNKDDDLWLEAYAQYAGCVEGDEDKLVRLTHALMNLDEIRLKKAVEKRRVALSAVASKVSSDEGATASAAAVKAGFVPRADAPEFRPVPPAMGGAGFAPAPRNGAGVDVVAKLHRDDARASKNRRRGAGRNNKIVGGDL